MTNSLLAMPGTKEQQSLHQHDVKHQQRAL